ncbi:MAG: glycosyl hydrolase family 28-related protein [Mycobacterium sp.]
MSRDQTVLSRRNALLAGVTTTAVVSLSACATETTQVTAEVATELGGLLVNARDFGVVGEGADVSRNLQVAIDFARDNGLTLYLPAGDYLADGLILRDQSRIRGAGPEATVIRAVPGSRNSAVLTIDSGPVRSVLLEGVGVIAADGNGEQHGIHVAARRVRGDNASGLWHSDFRNVRVYNFGGAQMWLQGGGQDALDPVQFLTFSNVVLERRHDSARSISLLMSGQVNQTLWMNGRIDGFGSRGEHPGVNVKICRQLDNYAPEPDGSTRYVSNRSGHSHLFANVSIQQGQLGVYVDVAESVTFDTCHFEALDTGLLFANTGQNRVDRCHFANSAQGGGDAFSIRAVDRSLVSGSENVFIGQYGVMASCDDSGAQVRLSNTMTDGKIVTQNLSRRIDPSSAISVGAATTVVLKASPTPIREVSASRLPGETLVFKASDGSVFFAPGGNIDFGTLRDSIEIAAGGTLTLVRFDDGASEWAVQAVHSAM